MSPMSPVSRVSSLAWHTVLPAGEATVGEATGLLTVAQARREVDIVRRRPSPPLILRVCVDSGVDGF